MISLSADSTIVSVAGTTVSHAPYCFATVSYTHLDVYKRQVFQRDPLFRGALRLNLLTEQIDIVKPLGCQTGRNLYRLLRIGDQNFIGHGVLSFRVFL